MASAASTRQIEEIEVSPFVAAWDEKRRKRKIGGYEEPEDIRTRTDYAHEVLLHGAFRHGQFTIRLPVPATLRDLERKLGIIKQPDPGGDDTFMWRRIRAFYDAHQGRGVGR